MNIVDVLDLCLAYCKQPDSARERLFSIAELDAPLNDLSREVLKYMEDFLLLADSLGVEGAAECARPITKYLEDTDTGTADPSA